MTKTMKAILYKKYGPPEVLHVGEIEKPVPKEDELLIRVHAAEATKADTELRRFKYPVKWFWLPLRIMMGIRGPRKPVLGTYFAGDIEAVGPAVTDYRPGQAVFGATSLRMGAYAEYLTVPARFAIVPKPNNLSYAEAAAVPLGGLNALHFMRLAKIEPGERVLINGAGGSIGLFAVQIAKSMGAHVTAVDAAHKQAMLASLGADEFIDYQTTDYHQLGQYWDVIFDMVASGSYSGAIDSLNPKGRYFLGNPRLGSMLQERRTNRRTDKTVSHAFAAETQDELLALKEMLEAGTIRPILDGIYPMEQAAEAHRRVETETRVGMAVIDLGPGS